MRTKTFKLFALVFSLFLISGCAGAADYSVKVNDKYEVSQINPKYHIFGGSDGSILTERDSGVNDNIIKMNWNEHFFIAKTEVQEKNGVVIKKHKDPLYWIFDLQQEKMYGELDETRFLELIKSKGIEFELVSYDEKVKRVNKNS